MQLLRFVKLGQHLVDVDLCASHDSRVVLEALLFRGAAQTDHGARDPDFPLPLLKNGSLTRSKPLLVNHVGRSQVLLERVGNLDTAAEDDLGQFRPDRVDILQQRLLDDSNLSKTLPTGLWGHGRLLCVLARDDPFAIVV